MSGYYFLKGLGAGAAIGLAVGIAVSPKNNGRGHGKTRVGRAVRSFGDIVDTIANTVTA